MRGWFGIAVFVVSVLGSGMYWVRSEEGEDRTVASIAIIVAGLLFAFLANAS